MRSAFPSACLGVASFWIWHEVLPFERELIHNRVLVRNFNCSIERHFLQAFPPGVDFLGGTAATNLVPVRAAFRAQAAAIRFAEEFLRYRQDQKLAHILAQIQNVRLGAQKLHFFLRAGGSRFYPDNIDNVKLCRQRVFEIIETTVARAFCSCVSFDLYVNLPTRLVQNHFRVDRLCESRIQADVCGVDIKGTVMSALRQPRNIDCQITHRSALPYHDDGITHKSKVFTLLLAHSAFFLMNFQSFRSESIKNITITLKRCKNKPASPEQKQPSIREPSCVSDADQFPDFTLYNCFSATTPGSDG